MQSILVVIDIILHLMMLTLIIQAVMSWLLAFNVLNMRNQFVAMIWNFLHAITDPLLRPIRRVIKPFNGLDLAPLVLLLLIFLLRDIISRYIFPNVF